MSCRNCASPDLLPILDLGTCPPSNALLTPEQLSQAELYHPLDLRVCQSCWLVQVGTNLDHDQLFTPAYPYFSSTSAGFVAHARQYVDQMTRRFQLDPSSQIVEIASNDGYLLQFFKAKSIPCLGVEPTHSTAEHARRVHDLEVIEEFFGRDLGEQIARERGKADLIVANNVLAHVPDIRDLLSGMAELLKAEGIATAEFPSLVDFVQNALWDTAYHEHYSYLSLSVISQIAEQSGLRVFDVETLSVHGGSLRVYFCRAASERSEEDAVAAQRRLEDDLGVRHPDFYTGLQVRAEQAKDALLGFLLQAKADGKRVAAYGAAAKGNTFLNYAGVRSDLIEFVADRAPAKQGHFLPGSRIPVVPIEEIARTRPDYLLILPWNIADEVMEQQSEIISWGGQFVIGLPELRVVSS